MSESRQQRRARLRAEAKGTRRDVPDPAGSGFGLEAPDPPPGPRTRPTPDATLSFPYSSAVALDDAFGPPPWDDLTAEDLAGWLADRGLGFWWVPEDETTEQRASRLFGVAL